MNAGDLAMLDHRMIEHSVMKNDMRAPIRKENNKAIPTKKKESRKPGRCQT